MKNYFKHKFREKSTIEIIGMVIFGAIAITGLAILFGFILMWLWNWLMPTLFGLSTVTYWQAVGLFILFKILLGGCGSGSSSSKKSKKNWECEDDKKSKSDFAKWEHYDDFWKEEGDALYKQYLDRKQNPQPPLQSEDSNERQLPPIV